MHHFRAEALRTNDNSHVPPPATVTRILQLAEALAAHVAEEDSAERSHDGRGERYEQESTLGAFKVSRRGLEPRGAQPQ